MAMDKIQSLVPFEESTPLLNTPDKLRERAQKEGYLFFKKLIPREAVLALRHDVLEVCKKHGFLDESAPLMDGIGAPGFVIVESSVNPKYTNFYREIQQLRSFHGLAHHPQLLAALDVLFGEKTFVHPLKILRTIFPLAQVHTTPPHQDYFHVRGTEDTWTSWIPLGDCPAELGGLTLVPRSHFWGLLPEYPAEGAGLIGIRVPEDSEWVTAEFEAGDVLMFHSHTVHQGIDNNCKDKMRISMDCRFQASGDKKIGPVAIRSPHLHCIDWESLYKTWPENDPLRFYWKDMDLEVDLSAPPTIGTPENPHPGKMA
jgi:hypothetical protein